jgi:large subunit ribosomal protein L30e
MKELVEYMKKGSLILGTKQVVKNMRKDTLQKVYLAQNCPDPIVEDIEHYVKLVGVPIEKLDVKCDELGALCKKPFLVSVIGVLK